MAAKSKKENDQNIRNSLIAIAFEKMLSVEVNPGLTRINYDPSLEKCRKAVGWVNEMMGALEEDWVNSQRPKLDEGD